MRQAGAPLPTALIVNPSGTIDDAPYHVNLGGVVRVRSGKDARGATIPVGPPYIAPQYREQGYRFLKELYAEDSRDEVREHGFRLYQEHVRQMKARAPGSRVKDKTGRLVPVEFPRELLPEEVVLRKEKRSAINGAGYQPPTLPAKPKGKRARVDAS